MKSWILSLILLVGSIILSVLFWMAGLPFFFLFLFVPLIPLISGRCTAKRCPVCGWETVGSERFCPYDATPLKVSGNHEKRETE